MAKEENQPDTNISHGHNCSGAKAVFIVYNPCLQNYFPTTKQPDSSKEGLATKESSAQKETQHKKGFMWKE